MLKIRIIIVGVYVCFTIVFLNFGINILPNYQLTIAFFYPIIFLLLGHFHFNSSYLKIYFFSIFLPIFIGIIGFISYFEFDFTHFLRTYSLYFHFCFSLLVINSIEPKLRIIEGIDKAVIIALLIVVIFTLLQVGISLYLGYPFFFNPFGKYLIGGESETSRFVLEGRVRPTGFYWEPSTDAVVILMLINYLVIRDINKFKKYYFTQFIIQFIINSTTGLVSTFLVFILWINSVTKKYIVAKLIIIISIILSFIYFYIDRLSQVANGGSGFFRWAIPFTSFIDYVQKYPLGLPLGQLTVQLDNGLFVALIYTGLFGLIAFLVSLFIFLKLLIRSELTLETQIFIISIFLLLIFNGAFLTPEMSFLICILTVAWKSKKLTF